jgi:alcohol dehydrogenase YqhD (iron-dependent ADH family)
MYSNFEYFTPTKVVFGKGTEKAVGELIQLEKCKKVLIHYGGKSAIRSGLIESVKKSLELVGISYVTLQGVVPNPHLSLVYEGIELCKKENVDFILAIGGGSVIDSAKAIGYGVVNEGDVWDFFVGKREAYACLPIGAVLTIAAAGSEMSNGCVITNEKKGLKRAYDTDLCRPKFSILNPELTITLPAYQTASGVVDILMHTMERYFNHSDNMSITDTISEALMRNVIKYAKILSDEPENYEARAEVMWAGSLAHNGLTGCGTAGGDWASHNMEHEIGGMFDVAHGAGLSAIWGSWARYVSYAAKHRFVSFAVNVLDVDPKNTDEEIIEKGISAMEHFYHSINMPISLKELGIVPTDEQIEQMAESCEQATGGANGCIVPLKKDDMVKIYHMAL